MACCTSRQKIIDASHIWFLLNWSITTNVHMPIYIKFLAHAHSIHPRSHRAGKASLLWSALWPLAAAAHFFALQSLSTHRGRRKKKRLVSQSKTQKDIVRLSTFHFVHGRAVGKRLKRRRGLHFLWRNNLRVIMYVLIVCRGSVYPELGALVMLHGLCMCVCEPFVLQTREGCGWRGSFLLSQTLPRQAGRAAAVGSFD